MDLSQWTESLSERLLQAQDDKRVKVNSCISPRRDQQIASIPVEWVSLNLSWNLNEKNYVIIYLQRPPTFLRQVLNYQPWNAIATPRGEQRNIWRGGKLYFSCNLPKLWMNVVGCRSVYTDRRTFCSKYLTLLLFYHHYYTNAMQKQTKKSMHNSYNSKI